MGKGSGDKEAKKARQAEEERQAEVRAGTQRINGIFDGTTAGADPLAAGATFDLTRTYYGADGKALSFAATAPTAAHAVASGQAFWNAINDGTKFTGATTTTDCAATTEEMVRAILGRGALDSAGARR